MIEEQKTTMNGSFLLGSEASEAVYAKKPSVAILKRQKQRVLPFDGGRPMRKAELLFVFIAPEVEGINRFHDGSAFGGKDRTRVC